MTVAAYVRRSSDAADEAARAEVRAWCQRSGAAVQSWRDEPDGRAHLVLDALLVDCREGRVRTIVVPALSHLHRRALSLLWLLDRILATGASVVAVRDNIGFDPPPRPGYGRLVTLLVRHDAAATGRARRLGQHVSQGGRPARAWTASDQLSYDDLRGRGNSIYRIWRKGLHPSAAQRHPPSRSWLRRVAEPRYRARRAAEATA